MSTLPGLSGTVAIVTGGGNGIGKAIVRKLADEGALVAIADINLDAGKAAVEEVIAAGGQAAAFQHDVTDWTSSFDLVAAVEQRLGPIGVLVNNAGVSRRVPFLEMDEAEWDRVLDINLKGQFLAARAVLPGMVDRRHGRIVNMSSVTGKKGFPNFSHYCASKFAVLGLTQSLAAEMAPYDVTVNAVCPGIVKTPLHEGILEQMASASNATVEAAWKDFVGMIPSKRPQEPEDIANMVAYLASDLAKNMTGCSYHVDGGFVMS